MSLCMGANSLSTISPKLWRLPLRKLSLCCSSMLLHSFGGGPYPTITELSDEVGSCRNCASST